MPKRSASDWVFEGLALAALVAIFIIVATHWTELPARVPKHFGISGNPDGWGSRNNMLLLPLLAVVVYIVATIASRYQQLINVPISIDRNTPDVQRLLQSMAIALKAVILCAFVYMEQASINTALERSAGLGKLFFPAFTLIIFLPLGVYLQKLRQYPKA